MPAMENICVQCGDRALDTESSNHSSFEKSGSMGKNFSYSFADEEEQLYESDTYAQPLVRSVWIGTFNIWYDESIYRRIDHCFHACLSNKACQKVCNVVAQLKPVLQFEMLPKSCLWPKRFQGSGPTSDDIGVYFFPSLAKHESLYDSLVFEMIRDDLAMRAFLQNSELLIFTSMELPSPFWRFQGKLYLWGVFRGKTTLIKSVSSRVLFHM